MSLQPSASRTALLLACPRPFDPGLEADPDLAGEPARYGSAFHQIIASCLRSSVKKPLEGISSAYAREVDAAAAQYDVRGAREELAGHVKSSVRVLRNWLDREKLEVVAVEKAYAIRPAPLGAWGARTILPHDEEHRYGVGPDEVPGTVDLIARSSNRARTVVIDHKTGSGESDRFAQPASIPQMRTLGLAATLHPSRHTEVGIFHADRRGLPIVYAEPYEGPARRGHAVELYEALSRIGSGFLRPGPHCARCPARLSCPAHAADLLAESTAALVSSANTLACEPISPTALYVSLAEAPPSASIEVRAGALYELLKKFRVLEKAGSDEIKRLVRGGAIVEMRDGRVLTLQTQNYETLSKKSVLEAFGKIAGEKELARLRKKGAIRETARELLIGEK